METLEHYGTPRHSGRYPYGSGKDPYQSSKSFLGSVRELKQQGLSEKTIAEGFGMTINQLRARVSIANSERRKGDYYEAMKLKEKGWSNTAIAEKLGTSESNVRNILKPGYEIKAEAIQTVAGMLQKDLDRGRILDIGSGVAGPHMGVSDTKLAAAVEVLRDQGYEVYNLKVMQAGTGMYTNIKCIAPKGMTYKDVYSNRDKIGLSEEWSEDGGLSAVGLEPVKKISADRVTIRYAEDGGINKDGVIEIRRGVEDLSLGQAKYAQVRIGVEGDKYLKGMAVYSDDIPDGYDIIFNTNKSKDVPKEKVLKSMENDPENPFKAVVRQRHYIDADGKEQLSAINLVREEGEWAEWSKNLSSQFLSKQPPKMAEKQLKIVSDAKQETFDEIMSYTNPTVRKSMLMEFADECDSAAVHLKAAALPRQCTHALLPLPDTKPDEIYAPNYRTGEEVALVRYPHAGPFEIPVVKVNNRMKKGNEFMAQAKDAVGIHPKVAERLSGADFDGDFVLVIPTKGTGIKSSPALEGLKNFDPKTAYPKYEGMKVMTEHSKQIEMGKVSNLITDMTIRGAKPDEIARAVRHSMVVIDAVKHELNHKQSYIDNGIAELKAKYQEGGASTLISRAQAEERVPTRKLRIDRETGEKVYIPKNDTYTIVDKKGNTITKVRETKSTKLAEKSDAFELSSGTYIEEIYATHSNRLKALANQARKEALATPNLKYNPSAKVAYAPEVSSLKLKLNEAQKNQPLERAAQLIANKTVAIQRAANPDLDKDDVKKLRFKALSAARARVGAGKKLIDITDREWEAIQAGAVSNNTLSQILRNTDMEKVKKRCLPRDKQTLSASRIAQIRSMINNGYTQAEVADIVGVSTSTINEYL